MTKILMVRHGQSEANNLEIFAGNYDIELTELGVRQAQCTAKFIAENYNVDKVYASDLKRAFKTAEYIAEKLGLEVVAEKNFREISAGKWEGEKFDVISTEYAEDWNKWNSDIGNSRCTDGESVKELAERVTNALKKFAVENEGKTIVIGTHATPVRAAQCVFGGYTFDDMVNIPWASNASVTELVYEDGNFTVVNASMDSHLVYLRSELPANV